MLNCVEIAISGFLCIYWVYGRRLWELMIDCWKRKKALELNFAQFFWPQDRRPLFLYCVHYWCSYCLLVQWKKTLWGQKDMYLKANKNMKSRNSSRWWRQLSLTKGWCWCCAFAILWVLWECQKFWWLWRMEVFFFCVEILQFDLEFGTQLNLQFDQWENVCNICGYS